MGRDLNQRRRGENAMGMDAALSPGHIKAKQIEVKTTNDREIGLGIFL
ncbi:MAG: hypothetical protein IPI44_24695 [Sulfuritalea sp.]|nr:hypothetical protein [Sulfuritalea sp.]